MIETKDTRAPADLVKALQGVGAAEAAASATIRGRDLGLGLWIRGLTPNFHTQTNLMPFAVNTPIACGGVVVMPGDIIVADDDGAVMVPVAIAAKVIEHANQHHEWEDYSREMLSKGGDLRRYYPLNDDARPEYEAWKKARAQDS